MFGKLKRKQPRQPSSEELALLDQFANCAIGLNELLAGLYGAIEINSDEDVRSLISNFLVAEPGILLCDAYIWDEADGDEIADKLHKLSLPQVFLRPEERPDLSR
jgi:hypothetical protein